MRETPAEIADRIVNRENTALVEKNRDFWRQRIEQSIAVSIAVAVSAERERCANIARFSEQFCKTELAAGTARAIVEAIENDAI
jgi:hypothetical protein